MVFENLWVAMMAAFGDLFYGVIRFLPRLVVVIVILILGWVVGALVSKLISRIFKTLRVDSALEAAGARQLVNKAGFGLNSGRFVGEIVKWFIVLVALLTVMSILGLSEVTFFLQGIVVGYLPQVIIAILILVVAIVLADVARKVVVASAKAAGLRKAGLLGSVTRWAIWIFAILAALFQLNIAATFIQTLFTGVVVAMSLALGLSFGLGGRDAAKEIIEDMRNEIKG